MMTTQQIYLGLFISLALLSGSLSSDLHDSDNNETTVQGRTFGHHFLKRISFAMIPAAFTVGVITTLLAALTVVSMKGLGVGVILLVIAVGQILARTIPQATYAPPPATAPLPVIYARKSEAINDPVWIEKDWQ